MRAPEITVVVPTYNRSGVLSRMVASLEAQTFPRNRFEVVIVDNASVDDTPGVLTDLARTTELTLRTERIEQNHGPAQARNRGWQVASAPFIAFIDDDCVPVPDWLHNGFGVLAAGDAVGVVQGVTRRPEGSRLGDWTLFREVNEPTPYFEGCNIFYRRDALEATGGFDETIGWYGEDTAAGWAVLEKGWARSFATGAVVEHDVVERGLGWHLRNAFLQGNFVALARRYPEFGQAALWRPWAFARHEPRWLAALVGLALAPWEPGALVLTIPWIRVRRPEWGHRRFLALLAERAAVDTAAVAGMLAASWRERRLVV